MQARDLHMKITTLSEVQFRKVRVWDAEKFLKSQTEYSQKEAPEAVIQVITAEEFKHATH